MKLNKDMMTKKDDGENWNIIEVSEMRSDVRSEMRSEVSVR